MKCEKNQPEIIGSASAYSFITEEMVAVRGTLRETIVYPSDHTITTKSYSYSTITKYEITIKIRERDVILYQVYTLQSRHFLKNEEILDYLVCNSYQQSILLL